MEDSFGEVEAVELNERLSSAEPPFLWMCANRTSGTS